MLVDDSMMRQLQKITELAAAITKSSSGAGEGDLERLIEEAYRALTGLDGALIDTLAAPSLLGLLADPRQQSALAELLDAHALVAEQKGDLGRAERRREKARALR